MTSIQKKANIKKIADLIRDEDNFLVATHTQPDGDAIGAILAFSGLLRKLGKKTTVSVAREDIPPQYRFLPGNNLFEQVADFKKHRVLVTLDAANSERLGDLSTALKECRLSLNIDHHPDNTGFADMNWVDNSISSSAEMVFNLWNEMNVPLTKDAAVCIYVGMLTDTGRWQYSNTGSQSLRIAAALVDAGVKPVEIFRKIYENYSVEWFKLLAVGVERAVFDQSIGLVHTVIKQKDLKETGATMAETENLVDWLRSVKDIKIAMVLKETKRGEYKASMRSRKPVNVGRLASEFGGGGHEEASGFVSTDKPDLIIEKVKKWLTAYS